MEGMGKLQLRGITFEEATKLVSGLCDSGGVE